MDEALAAAIMALAVLMLCAGIALLGVGAWWFAKAVREAHTARAHAAQADDTQRTIDAAYEAIANVDTRRPVTRVPLTPDFVNPTDQELRDILLEQRNNGHAYAPDVTTTGNEGIPEQPPIGGGGPYRGVGGFDG